MGSTVEKCKTIVDGKEAEFIGGYLGVEILLGRDDECALLTDAFACVYPQDFVRAVGAFLHDCEGVV